MGNNLFHNCKLLFSQDLSFEIKLDDIIFYNYVKDLDKPHNYKGTELCVMGVAN
jgi:hypothetical protein